MKLQIERPYVEAMVREFPRLASLQEQFKLGSKAEVAFSHRSEERR